MASSTTRSSLTLTLKEKSEPQKFGAFTLEDLSPSTNSFADFDLGLPSPVPYTPSEIERPRPESQGQSRPASRAASPEPFKPGWRFVAAFLSMAVITLMAALDATSLSVALPVMAKALKGTAIEAFWSGTSFLLTSTVFQPILGSFSHIFGRKPLIYISLFLFGAGSLIGALANNFTVVLVGRSIQGTGGGGVIVLTEIVVTDMVPLRERGKWMSIFSAMWAIGTVCGPLLGGGFAYDVSWRWIFYINLPFLAVSSVAVTIFLKLNYKTSSFLDKLRRVDWFGMTLFLGSSTSFLIPLTWGGVMYAWTSWRTLVPLIVGAIGLIGFVIHQKWYAPEPLVRLDVFSTSTASITYLGTFIHGIILWSILYYLPLYYEVVKEMSPLMAGVALFPQTFTVAPAAGITGAMIAKTGKYRWAIWTGWFFTTTGNGLLILLEVDSKTWEWVLLALVGGIGTGMLFPALAVVTQASSKARDQAYAATMFSFIRAFGQTIGVAVGGVIFQNQMRDNMLTHPLLAENALEYSKDAAGLVQIVKNLPDGPYKLALKESYTDALKHIWVVMTVFAAVALVASLFIKAYSLVREMETEQGFIEERSLTDTEKGEKGEKK